MLTGAVAVAAAGGWPRVSVAQSPPALEITPALIEAAKKEGRVNYYTSVEIKVAERMAKLFEAKYPGIAVKVERSGAERNFQRIGQEYASKIYNCDTVNSSDAAHFIVWKRDGLLEPVLPADVAKHYAPEFRDADGTHATWGGNTSRSSPSSASCRCSRPPIRPRKSRSASGPS